MGHYAHHTPHTPPPPTQASVTAQPPTLAEVLVAEPSQTPYSFKTLAAAVEAVGLLETLADPTAGPFTVFLPTDTAFARVLAGLGVTPEEILADVETLNAILLNHCHLAPG